MAEVVQYGDFSYDNPMRAPRISKIVVNIGVGEAGDKLMKAEKVMGAITGMKPSRTIAKKSVRDWGVREGMPIGVRVTLRGEAAEKFLERALWVRQHKIPDYGWDDFGNLNFGVADHTDFEGQKYDPEIGIFGMDIAVVVERGGSRIKHRRLQPAKVPMHHRLTREESMAFFQSKFKVEVL